MGIVEVGRVLTKFINAFRKLKAAAIERSPDAVILVDWPEFNLRLASALHRRGLKVIYYISPQLWAWRAGRVSKIKPRRRSALVDPSFRSRRGTKLVAWTMLSLSVTHCRAKLNRVTGAKSFAALNDLDPARPIVSFLPGSRKKELERILPPMLDAIQELETGVRMFSQLLSLRRSR